MNGHRAMPVFLYSKKKSVPLITPVLDTGVISKENAGPRHGVTDTNTGCKTCGAMDPGLRRDDDIKHLCRGMTSKENAGPRHGMT